MHSEITCIIYIIYSDINGIIYMNIGILHSAFIQYMPTRLQPYILVH